MLERIRELSFFDLKLTVEAGFELLRALFFIHFTSFSYYSHFLGSSVGIDYQYIPLEADLKLLYALKYAVLRFARRSPVPTRCLAQAIAIRQMTKRRGIDCELYLGVRKLNDKLIAHAWTKHGDVFLTGAKGYQHFIVVGRFLTIC